MTEENNAPAEDTNPDGLAADERARLEIQKEREAAAAPSPAIENLIGTDAQVDEDAQARADLDAVLAQSIDGRSLSQRQVNYARESALAFEKDHPELSEQWAEWARQSANHTGWVMKRLAEGELPTGGPDKYADQLAGVTDRWKAQAELDELYRQHPVGSASYASAPVQRRVQALFQFISGGEPLVGRSNRRA